MTIDEQRQAWRVYAAAALVALDVTKDGFGEICDVAEEMLNREMERFKGPDHSGDADKMVDPRPWVDLTEAEITQIVAAYYATYADLVRLTQDRLREKNGGTR